MGLIFAVSAQPSLPEAPDPLLDILVKKLGHMTEYAILCLLLWGALPADAPLWAWALAVLYAVSDEIHQTLVPGRNGWIVDVLVDGVGAGLAALAVWRLRVSRDA
jgi:VanZ family protein